VVQRAFFRDAGLARLLPTALRWLGPERLGAERLADGRLADGRFASRRLTTA